MVQPSAIICLTGPCCREAAATQGTRQYCLQGMPLQCSVFLTQHADILRRTNAGGAAYLFQPDKLHAEYDLGDKTIQCGRRPDAFKLWLAWKVCMILTAYLAAALLSLSSSGKPICAVGSA